MESDFQKKMPNYSFVPVSGVNRPLQEVNIDQGEFRAGSSRRVHRHAWVCTSAAAVRRGRRYKTRA